MTSIVEKMDLPTTATPWVQAPSMTMPRYNHNAVILPTGSILVVGGRDYVGGSCVAGLNPEFYRPPEIFGTVAQDVWHLVNVAQQIPRFYHSVAGLLPDGRVFSAGGSGLPASSGVQDPAWHSVELFSPAYMFFARPVIADWPDPTLVLDPETIPLGQEISITVTTSTASATIERIVLVRNAATTHAQDMNQRYVVLRPTADLVNGTTHALTLAPLPFDGYATPAGYYLLFAVQRTDEPNAPKLRPSEGRWVKVLPP